MLSHLLPLLRLLGVDVKLEAERPQAAASPAPQLVPLFADFAEERRQLLAPRDIEATPESAHCSARQHGASRQGVADGVVPYLAAKPGA